MRKNKAYSDPSARRRASIFFAILAYFGGLLIGLVFTIAVPALNNRANLFQMAEDQARSILDTLSPSSGPTFGTEFYLLAEDGTVVYANTEFLHPDERAKLAGFAEETIRSGRIYLLRSVKMGEAEDKGGHALCIICGVMQEAHSGRPFAGILLRDLKDLDVSIETFVGIYTLLFVTAILLILYIVKEQRELNQLRRDLVANVSHELKTPITSIKAIAEILHDGLANDPKEIHRYSASILAETDNLEDMVMEILELSKLQSRLSAAEKDLVYTDGLFRPLIDRYMMLCGDLGVELCCGEPEYDAIPPLYTDVENMTKVLSVLLDNAVKFSGRGGKVWLKLEPGRDCLTVCIRDNGPGIRAEDLDHIFERFYKADVSRNSKGSGLGLAIAHEIVKSLGEKLWVESDYGKGSAFYCTIHYK